MRDVRHDVRQALESVASAVPESTEDEISRDRGSGDMVVVTGRSVEPPFATAHGLIFAFTENGFVANGLEVTVRPPGGIDRATCGLSHGAGWRVRGRRRR
jgi:hypothetical protein